MNDCQISWWLDMAELQLSLLRRQFVTVPIESAADTVWDVDNCQALSNQKFRCLLVRMWFVSSRIASSERCFTSYQYISQSFFGILDFDSDFWILLSPPTKFASRNRLENQVTSSPLAPGPTQVKYKNNSQSSIVVLSIYSKYLIFSKSLLFPFEPSFFFCHNSGSHCWKIRRSSWEALSESRANDDLDSGLF